MNESRRVNESGKGEVKRRIFQIIQIGNRTDVPSMCFDLFIILVILTNISVTFLQTFEGAAKYADALGIVELITMLIFLAEYVLRMWTSDCLYPDRSYPAAVLGFALSFNGVVDLLTILPYFCPFFIPSGAIAFRMLRVVRILRLFRINARYDAFNVITEVLKEKKNALVSSIFLVLVLMLASSFGVDAASIVAVLGSAGVAIGLAIQGSLSNLAGGVLILLLKPFRVGDYILESSGGREGTVTEIQIFYTRLLTPDNKAVILPNGNLANNSIVNMTQQPHRRMDLRVSVSYDADLKLAKETLSGVLEEDPAVLPDMDRLVFVDELGDSAVILGVRCWFKQADFWTGKWRVTENCKLALDQAGIQIPYNQLDVHLYTIS